MITWMVSGARFLARRFFGTARNRWINDVSSTLTKQLVKGGYQTWATGAFVTHFLASD